MHAASPIGSAARSRAQLCTSRPAPLVPQQAAHCAQQRKRQLPPPAALPAAATAAAAAAAAAAAPAALAQPLVELAEALDEAPVWTLDQAVGLVFGGLLLLLYLSSSQVDKFVARSQRRQLGLCEECGGLFEPGTCQQRGCPARRG